jgi:hypothetical protein
VLYIRGMPRLGLVVLSLLASPLAAASGQRLSQDRSAPNPLPSGAALIGSARDHRWEGAIIGAAALGAGGAVLRAAWCGNDDSASAPRDCTGTTIVWGLMGATVGAVAGGLLGSAFKK